MPPVHSRYARGKIYKFTNSVDNKIYIGSTCLSLAKRKYIHKRDASRQPNRLVYQHLNSIGWENVQIILIETCYVNNNDELRQREQHYIDILKPSLNKNAAYTHCPHGREHNKCKDCGGASICEHNKRKSRCKICGGVSICEHNKRKQQCKICIGDKYHCYECKKSFSCKSALTYHNTSNLHKKKYKEMESELDIHII